MKNVAFCHDSVKLVSENILMSYQEEHLSLSGERNMHLVLVNCLQMACQEAEWLNISEGELTILS